MLLHYLIREFIQSRHFFLSWYWYCY